LKPDRVIYLEAGDEKAILACFEECLRHRGLGAAVAEVARLSMTASRRLQLAAEESGTIGIALRRLAPTGRGIRLRPPVCRNDEVAYFDAALNAAARSGRWPSPMEGRTDALPRRREHGF
jgi:hypothetical protein